MDSNKDSWVGEKIFRISCNLSASYLKYIKGDLQLEGVSIHGMIDYFINYHFCDLTNDLAKLENSAIKLSVKQQEIIKNCYAIIKQETKLILQYIESNLQNIESNLQNIESTLESPEQYQESKEILSKLIKYYDTIIADEIKLKEQLTQKKETLCKLKNDTMQLYSRPELQELQLKEAERELASEIMLPQFNINDFISDIKSLLSNEQIYDTKQIAKDAGLSTTEFNNYILTSLIPELNHSISRISKQEELNENQSKDVADLTNYITSFKEEILNENKNQSINNTPIDPIPAQKKADNKNVKGNSRKRLKESMCRIL